jgi:hypothetical protein
MLVSSSVSCRVRQVVIPRTQRRATTTKVKLDDPEFLLACSGVTAAAGYPSASLVLMGVAGSLHFFRQLIEVLECKRDEEELQKDMDRESLWLTEKQGQK